MINFCEIIKRKQESDAFGQGVDAFYASITSDRPLQKMLRSPYALGSKADEEWLDGYQDAYFVHYGGLINGTRD